MAGRAALSHEFEALAPLEPKPYDAVPVYRGSDFDAFATGSRQV
jgi:hypothetical protein